MKKKNIFFILIIFILFSCSKNQPLVIKNYRKLPEINLTIDEKYLWSPDSGLYVIGNNGIMGCELTANFNQKWEFPARISLKLNNELVFDELVGFRIKGNCSREYAMKSFGIYWRSDYGNKKLEYPIFPNISISEYKRLFLRNSGNDFGRTQIKDACITQIIKDYAHVDYQEYRPSVLYLNDEYWGIYNIREMITPHHFEYHYGVDDDFVDLLEGSELSPSADDGSIDDFVSEVIHFIQENDLSEDANYQIISERIDINSYIDYIIIETYIGNGDWPCRNAKWWRDKTSVEYNKWKWVVFDTDFGFLINEVDKVWIGDLYGRVSGEYRDHCIFIFNKLLKNQEFKTIFLSRYLFFIDTVFEKERVAQIIKQIQSDIEDEYTNHQSRWKTLSENSWNSEIDKMVEYNNIRNDKLREIIINLMQ